MKYPLSEKKLTRPTSTNPDFQTFCQIILPLKIIFQDRKTNNIRLIAIKKLLTMWRKIKLNKCVDLQLFDK